MRRRLPWSAKKPWAQLRAYRHHGNMQNHKQIITWLFEICVYCSLWQFKKSKELKNELLSQKNIKNFRKKFRAVIKVPKYFTWWRSVSRAYNASWSNIVKVFSMVHNESSLLNHEWVIMMSHTHEKWIHFSIMANKKRLFQPPQCRNSG